MADFGLQKDKRKTAQNGCIMPFVGIASPTANKDFTHSSPVTRTISTVRNGCYGQSFFLSSVHSFLYRDFRIREPEPAAQGPCPHAALRCILTSVVSRNRKGRQVSCKTVILLHIECRYSKIHNAFGLVTILVCTILLISFIVLPTWADGSLYLTFALLHINLYWIVPVASLRTTLQLSINHNTKTTGITSEERVSRCFSYNNFMTC